MLPAWLASTVFVPAQSRIAIKSTRRAGELARPSPSRNADLRPLLGSRSHSALGGCFTAVEVKDTTMPHPTLYWEIDPAAGDEMTFVFNTCYPITSSSTKEPETSENRLDQECVSTSTDRLAPTAATYHPDIFNLICLHISLLSNLGRPVPVLIFKKQRIAYIETFEALNT